MAIKDTNSSQLVLSWTDTKKIALAYNRKDIRGQERARKNMHTVRKFTEIETEKQERRLTCPEFVTHSKPRV